MSGADCFAAIGMESSSRKPSGECVVEKLRLNRRAAYMRLQAAWLEQVLLEASGSHPSLISCAAPGWLAAEVPGVNSVVLEVTS